jgi:hypothetical protein
MDRSLPVATPLREVPPMSDRLFRLFLVCGGLAVLAPAAPAQQKDDGLLAEVRRRELIAAQALQQEVQAALSEADRPKADRAKAVAGLKAAVAKLEADMVLSDSQRKSLLASVRGKLKALGEDPAPDADKKRIDELAREAKRIEARKQAEIIKYELEAIKSLRQQGRAAEAQRRAEELARLYPDDPAVQQARRGSTTDNALRDATKLGSEKDRASALTLKEVDKSATPIPGEVQYPPKSFWDEISKKRLAKYGTPPMSEKEKAIVNTLNQSTSEPVQLKDMPFEQALKFLEKELGLPILVSRAALDELKVTYDMTLSVTLPRGISKRSLLRAVLGELGMTYVIKNEAIEVTSILRAQNELITRVYDIRDVLGFGQALGLKGRTEEEQANALIDFIQDNCDPGSWKKHGGPGTIIYAPAQKALIIRNTAEVISMVRSGTTSK